MLPAKKLLLLEGGTFVQSWTCRLCFPNQIEIKVRILTTKEQSVLEVGTHRYTHIARSCLQQTHFINVLTWKVLLNTPHIFVLNPWSYSSIKGHFSQLL